MCYFYLFMLIAHDFIYECICEDLALLIDVLYICYNEAMTFYDFYSVSILTTCLVLILHV